MLASRHGSVHLIIPLNGSLNVQFAAVKQHFVRLRIAKWVARQTEDPQKTTLQGRDLGKGERVSPRTSTFRKTFEKRITPLDRAFNCLSHAEKFRH